MIMSLTAAVTYSTHVLHQVTARIAKIFQEKAGKCKNFEEFKKCVKSE